VAANGKHSPRHSVVFVPYAKVDKQCEMMALEIRFYLLIHYPIGLLYDVFLAQASSCSLAIFCTISEVVLPNADSIPAIYISPGQSH
jgi:hypothetical protein